MRAHIMIHRLGGATLVHHRVVELGPQVANQIDLVAQLLQAGNKIIWFEIARPWLVAARAASNRVHLLHLLLRIFEQPRSTCQTRHAHLTNQSWSWKLALGPRESKTASTSNSVPSSTLVSSSLNDSRWHISKNHGVLVTEPFGDPVQQGVHTVLLHFVSSTQYGAKNLLDVFSRLVCVLDHEQGSLSFTTTLLAKTLLEGHSRRALQASSLK